MARNKKYDREAELKKFLRSIGKSDEADESKDTFAYFFDDAIEEALNYCNRDEVHVGMSTSIRDLARIRYNQEGAEGESSRSEGGVSQSYEEGIPRRVRSVLNRYRLAKVRRF